MRTLGTFFVLLTVIAAANPDSARPQIVKETAEPRLIDNVSGVYRITGEGANGKPYNGIATVRKPLGTQCYVIGQIVGNEFTTGLGMLVDKTLVISWKQGEALGITRVDFDGRDAKARWITLPGSGQFNTETWTFLAANEE